MTDAKPTQLSAAPTSEEISSVRLEIKLNLECDSMLDEPERAMLRKVDFMLESLARRVAELERQLAEAQERARQWKERALKAESVIIVMDKQQTVLNAERYRFWRHFYDCRFAIKLTGTSVGLSFRPARPEVEIADDYESKVDAALDAARAALAQKEKA